MEAATIDKALDYIVASSGGNYRLALVTPDTDNDNNPTNNLDYDDSGHDMVDVRIPFTNSISAFEAAVMDPDMEGDGGSWPEKHRPMPQYGGECAACQRKNQ